MIKRTLYFGNPAYLSLKDAQLIVRLPEVESLAKRIETEVPQWMKEAKTTIPIEDIGVVVLDNKQITVTQALLEALLDNNVAFITCNNQHLPTGLLLNLNGNTLQSEKFRNQIDASVPLKKQLWQQTVESKIYNQAQVLKQLQLESLFLDQLAKKVRSGDEGNAEATAAAYYWKTLSPLLDKISNSFIRNRDGLPPNNLLNYGYALLRAIVARNLVGSGLLPTFGIHHRNKYNAYCLADDIMEPYRPYVDLLVIDLVKRFDVDADLPIELKKELLLLPTVDVIVNKEKSPLMLAVQRTTASLSKCYDGKEKKILYPKI